LRLSRRIIAQEGKEAFTEYDNVGRISIDGANNEIVHQYDDPTATAASFYAPVQIDYPTYTRKLYYDNLQRLIRTIDILDAGTSDTASYIFDAAGNLISEVKEK